MRPMPIIAAAAFLFSASGPVTAANPTRIAETGAFLLGNAYRCGIADERVLRAGKVIRELIVAAAVAGIEIRVGCVWSGVSLVLRVSGIILIIAIV